MNTLTTLWRNRFSSFRSKRIIVGNFILLALAALLSATMFYFFVDSIYKRNAEKTLYTSGMNNLVRLGDTMAIYFANFGQMMDIAMRNKDFISATVTPNANHYERNKSILTYLAALAAGNELIESAYYYIGETGYVYTSKGMMVKLEQFAFKNAVGDFLRNGPGKEAMLGAEDRLRLARYGSDIFILQDFFTIRRLGTMFFRIDADVLYSLTSGKTPRSQGGMHTYDADLEPLFPDKPYPEASKEALAALRQKSGDEPVSLRGASYCRFVDPNTGWLYLLALSSGYSFGQKLALGVIVPFLFFFLAVNLAVFLYSTLSVYRPVNEILKSIADSAETAPSSGRPSGARNEFDFIKNAFTHMAGENEHYESLLQKFAPGAQERLFTHIISGRETSSTHVLDVLHGVRSPFADDDRFLVVAFRLDMPGEHNRELEADVAKVDLQNALAKEISETPHLFWFLGKNDDIVAVAGFRAESSQFRLERFLAAVDRCAKETGAKTPWSIFWGCGDTYADIRDVSHSYGEAVKALRIKQYADTDRRLPAETEKLAITVSMESAMEKQAEMVWRHIMDQELALAQNAALNLVADTAKGRRGRKKNGDGFIVLTNVFIKRLVDMRISPEELAETERMMVRPGSGEDDEAAMRKFVLHCIATLDGYNRKRQNKYILGAGEYISEHYSDSDLSLSSVSEHLGIHSSYLSRLFNESENKSFTTALNEHRIEMAKQLLSLTEQSVADIGFKTGFNSAQNFIRVFKKHTGATPGQFREQHASLKRKDDALL